MKKLIVFILLFPFAVFAQKDYTSLMDNYMEAQVNFSDFGGAVLVAKKGKVIYKKAFGMAIREWNVPNTLQTKFRIGSVTKQFTAAAILQLAEQGKLTLDDKLSKYVPDFPKGDSVTIHMLLNHTSGIKSYTNMPTFSTIEPLALPPDSVVAFFKNQPYEFPPGSQYNYNNSGYFLLGYIIEKASKQTYGSYIKQNLIAKAGLTNTGVNQLDSILANRAAGYIQTPLGWKNGRFISMECAFSAGAIISTVEDLYKWQNALFNGKIISPASYTKMTTPYLNNYGYGLVVDSFENRRRIGHSGGIVGFQSYLVRFPEDEVSIAFISNNEINNGIPEMLAAIAFNLTVIPPYQHKEVAIDPKLLRRYTGRYERPNSPYIDTVKIENGKLYVYPQDANNKKFEMKAESQTKFFVVPDLDVQFEFEVDNEGKVRKAYTIDWGIKREIKKNSD